MDIMIRELGVVAHSQADNRLQQWLGWLIDLFNDRDIFVWEGKHPFLKVADFGRVLHNNTGTLREYFMEKCLVPQGFPA
jgi:hypothetical protein